MEQVVQVSKKMYTWVVFLVGCFNLVFFVKYKRNELNVNQVCKF